MDGFAGPVYLKSGHAEGSFHGFACQAHLHSTHASKRLMDGFACIVHLLVDMHERGWLMALPALLTSRHA